MEAEYIKNIREFAKMLRINVLNTAYATQGKNAHLGGALSMCEILAVLFKKVMNLSVSNFPSQNRDKFILSKSHASFPLILLLKEKGLNPKMTTHLEIDVKNGINCTTGSLGHGLPISVGMALARKKMKTSSC